MGKERYIKSICRIINEIKQKLKKVISNEQIILMEFLTLCEEEKGYGKIGSQIFDRNYKINIKGAHNFSICDVSELPYKKEDILNAIVKCYKRTNDESLKESLFFLSRFQENVGKDRLFEVGFDWWKFYGEVGPFEKNGGKIKLKYAELLQKKDYSSEILLEMEKVESIENAKKYKKFIEISERERLEFENMLMK
ncbi:hypothetical protein [Nitrospina gracilis]|uniref:hypothetical protein n=1 Tax=Nitrospina gracilis TaxID=35801 RepID=UPI001F336DF7|nr:hypothetical protein [Nitrospina gracilis]MCF8719810.1 hypothetical protein [Nitrospina gracilis Nb-211]